MKELMIPAGYQRVMPYLILRKAEEFIQFTQTVFDATEKMRHMRDEKEIMHAEIQIGDVTIMFGQAGDNWAEQPAGLFVYVEDADETYKKALENGATSVMEPADRDYGRSAGIKDPCGNTWWITSVKNEA
ncbi:VOC family protein [Pedobacter sp. SYSU D00535]|uniref:VOC family protein n=1 Tax=Pedobacter sp. SYSU D00535 TaxID=2810308 RepID=UPI001A96B228|nr:VOC family protein [Pedobacter sp. SYSU D00535]